MSQITKVKKRNGQIVDFDQSKISEAIWKAAQSVGGRNKSNSEQIANQVRAVLEIFYKEKGQIPSVEKIQDLIEKILIEGGHAKTAKAFILYRANQKKLRKNQAEILDGQKTKIPLSEKGLKIIKTHWLKNKNNEHIETPEEFFERISKALFNQESSEQRIALFKILSDLSIILSKKTIQNLNYSQNFDSETKNIEIQNLGHFYELLSQISKSVNSGTTLRLSLSALPSAGETNEYGKTFNGVLKCLEVLDHALSVINLSKFEKQIVILPLNHPDAFEIIESLGHHFTPKNFQIAFKLERKNVIENLDLKINRIFRDVESNFIQRTEDKIKTSELIKIFAGKISESLNPPILFFTDEVSPKINLSFFDESTEKNFADYDVSFHINLENYLTDYSLEENMLKSDCLLVLNSIKNHLQNPQRTPTSEDLQNIRVAIGFVNMEKFLEKAMIKADSLDFNLLTEKIHKILKSLQQSANSAFTFGLFIENQSLESAIFNSDDSGKAITHNESEIVQIQVLKKIQDISAFNGINQIFSKTEFNADHITQLIKTAAEKGLSNIQLLQFSPSTSSFKKSKMQNNHILLPSRKKEAKDLNQEKSEEINIPPISSLIPREHQSIEAASEIALPPITIEEASTSFKNKLNGRI